MAREPFATVEELGKATGLDIAGADVDRARSLLERASEIVRAEAGRTWLDDDGTLVDGWPEQLAGVVIGMVERAVQNPQGITQETAGPFSRSFGTNAASRLWLSTAEREVVRAAAGRAGLQVLSVTRGPLETPDVRDPFAEVDRWP